MRLYEMHKNNSQIKVSPDTTALFLKVIDEVFQGIY